ncbi:MAG: hypothetical protein GEU96_03075 [Propionibacteriales bacterium]|nr:hypothetical protein [Propionibacteriales bacterium]
MNLTVTSTRTRGPAEELRHRLDVAVEHSPGLPALDELTTEQPFAMVDSWRQVARAATFGEHDFDAGLGYGRISQIQCMTLLKDASEVARGLVGLDRRYANIPGWQSLKDAGWLGRAAEVCSTFAGYDGPDYTIDLRGWQPRRTLVEGPGLPGLTGVVQAQHNLLVHLEEFPDARSLRLVLDSQRIVSRDATALDPTAAADWARRASTYLRLIHATHDIGGMVGNGSPAAGEAALAACRMERFTRAVHAGTDTAVPGALRHLARLGREIDERITQVIRQGARERIYFARVPFPRVDKDAAALVKSTRQRYVPMTADVCQELLDLVSNDLRPNAEAPQAPTRAAASREELAAALVHRPEPRRTRSGLSL